jgi:hypothetical protein
VFFFVVDTRSFDCSLVSDAVSVHSYAILRVLLEAGSGLVTLDRTPYVSGSDQRTCHTAGVLMYGLV